MIGAQPDKVGQNRAADFFRELCDACLRKGTALAIFGNSILAAGEAQKYSIDIRREADKGMKDLQNALYAGGSGAEIKGKKTSAITEIEAYKYETADGLVYWVFQNKPGENGGAE